MRSIKHLGDICKINGANIEKVDVITFGAPCQDISIAGKRDGIKHTEHGDEKTTRSGLFFEALRIIREMREDDEKRGRAIQFIRPRYAIYENVGGLTSSNNGRDFQKVLTEFVKIVEPDAPEIPMPEKGGWPHADAIYGVGANGEPFSIAWRLHDAAKWGVHQRRKRYCVLADFNGFSAAEILFDPQFERMPARGMSITPDRNLGTDRRPEVQTQPESLSGDSAESGTPREGAATAIESGADPASAGRTVCYGISAFDSNAMKSPNPHSGIYEAETARTLDLNGGSPACNQGGMAVVSWPDVANTIPARMDGSPCIDRGPPIVACLNPWDPQSARVYDANGIWHSLNANENGGQSRDAVFVYENHGQDSRVKELGDICESVSAKYGTGGNNTPLVLTAIPVEGNGTRPYAVEKHAVCIGNGQMNNLTMKPIANTLDTMDDTQKILSCTLGTFSLQRSDEHKESDKAHTLSARDYKDATDLIVYAPDVSHALKSKANLQFREDGETYIVAGFSYGQSAKAGGIGYEEGKSPTLRGGQGGNQIPCIAAVDCRNGTINSEVNGTLQAKEQGFNTNSNNVVLIYPEVRRLTPLECERLQEFPDNWSKYGLFEDGTVKELSDSARFKIQGNSIARPYWTWLLRRIAAQYERQATLGGLFSGQGGFELCAMDAGIKPLWCSEIEKNAVAVMKYRFPEVDT